MAGKLNGRLAEDLRSTEARLKVISQEVMVDPDKTVDYFLVQQAQSRTDEILDLDLDDLAPEQQRRAIDEYHRHSTIGSVLLYSDLDFKGKKKFFAGTWPNFKWWPYKFNDRASSVKAWGLNILFEHTWYRGRRLYLIGHPYMEFVDLRLFDFNDIASSKL